jgi:hypothetical protein
MSGWGIAKTASEKEKIKSEFADFINGLNSVGEIDYNIYSELFDFTMPLFDKMFEHGKTIAQQPLSGSDAETSSPKSATPTSDNGKRCTQSQN